MVLQWVVSVEGVILINTCICEKQSSEKLKYLPKVDGGIVVEPGL